MLRCQQDDKPFRLTVSIIRGTNAGRALGLMSSGIQCASETQEGGVKLFDDYVDAAHAVLDNVSEGICFGLVALIDTRTGSLVKHYTLMGRDKDTTLGQATA